MGNQLSMNTGEKSKDFENIIIIERINGKAVIEMPGKKILT